MSKTRKKTAPLKCSASSSPVPRRLTLALPSPQNSDIDEPMRNFEDDASSSPDSLQLSHSLSSPRDSDVDEPLCSDTGNSQSSSSELNSTASFTGMEVTCMEYLMIMNALKSYTSLNLEHLFYKIKCNCNENYKNV